MVSIGNIQLGEHPLFLAPMENITDASFRKLCRKFGADMVFTEFVSADELLHRQRHALEKLKILPDERPVGIQLYGHVTRSMVEAAKRVEEVRPDVIDLNFGCPARKIARRGAGAGMLRDPEYLLKMTEAVVRATNLPVTVKTRLGWDAGHRIIVDLALRLQDTGIRALTIHGRTGDQAYRGKADWHLIGEVKNHPGIHIPVIGNGDVDGPGIAAERLREYGVDGIMIGRAAIGQPWLFRDIRDHLSGKPARSAPDLQERVDLAAGHFKDSLAIKGIPRGIYEMRGHLIRYFQEYEAFQSCRQELLTSTEPAHIMDLLHNMGKRGGK